MRLNSNNSKASTHSFEDHPSFAVVADAVASYDEIVVHVELAEPVEIGIVVFAVRD